MMMTQVMKHLSSNWNDGYEVILFFRLCDTYCYNIDKNLHERWGDQGSGLRAVS